MNNLDINHDITLEIILISDEDSIINMCKTNRQIRNICLQNKNIIAKHIMKDIYKLHKPESFTSYASFYKHFKKSRKSAPYLFGLNENPTKQEISQVYNEWYKYIDLKLKQQNKKY